MKILRSQILTAKVPKGLASTTCACPGSLVKCQKPQLLQPASRPPSKEILTCGLIVFDSRPCCLAAPNPYVARQRLAACNHSTEYSLPCNALPKPLYSVQIRLIVRATYCRWAPPQNAVIHFKPGRNAASRFKASTSMHSSAQDLAGFAFDLAQQKNSRWEELHWSICHSQCHSIKCHFNLLHANLAVVSTRSKHSRILRIPVHRRHTLLPALPSSVSRQRLDQ